MPSNFILIAAAVAALSPKSHGRLIFMWVEKYTDAFGRETLDTYGRCAYYVAIVLFCKFFEWVGL